MREQHALLGRLHVGDPPREALAQHGRERIHVTGSRRAFAARLLGGDVVDRAHELARLGHAGVVAALGEPEVREVGVVAGAHEHVLGLHVAVDQFLRVRGVERLRHLREQAQRAPVVELAAHDQLLERGTLHHPHREEQTLVGLTGLIHRDDVGVVERGLQ